MRIRLTLSPVQHQSIIPINYQYPLSAAIYKILESASPDYAEFLHDKGYLSEQGKPFKLFTFSRLWCKNIKQVNTTLIIKNSPCILYISSPMLQDFIQNFVLGLFQNQQITISSHDTVAHFNITQVETLATPQFSPQTKFTCISPVVISTMHEYQGKLSIYYLRPEDEGLSDAISTNLINKYKTIHQKTSDNLTIKFLPDVEYIQKKHAQHKRLTKKITIKEGNIDEQTEIIAFELPFILTGSTELMEIAYECGMGEKNSMGFGMIEVIS